MAGGLGNDTYGVDATGDVITEVAGEGTDTVETTVAITLGANVENLKIMNTSKVGGTGNALDNVITGNIGVNALSGGAGNDRLDGGAGSDPMTGGAGNDTFVVDVTGDTTVEAAGGGIDTVEAALTWTLGTEVERLLLTGTAANGTGNTLSNWLTGNASANTLNGGANADVLVGAAGNDILQDTAGNGALDGGAGNDVMTTGAGSDLLAGGAGNDTYTLGAGSDIIAFNRGDGADTVNAPLSGAGLGETNDVVSLGKVRLSEFTLSRETSDLVLKISGTTDSLRLKDWYLGAGDQTFGKLQVIVDSSIDYAPGTGDVLRSSRVVVLDMKQLVAGHDAARASNPSLVNWQPNEALLQSALISASDTMAYGGNLAYRYGEDSTLANAQYETAIAQLVGTFGSAMQDILA